MSRESIRKREKQLEEIRRLLAAILEKLSEIARMEGRR